MKKLKSAIALGIILLAFVSGTNAQTISEFRQMSFEQKAQFITDSLTATLSLSTEQSKNVYALALSGSQQVKQIADMSGDRREKRKKLRSLLLSEESKLKDLLTADQLSLYETKKQNLINYYRKNLKDQPIIFNVPA